MAHWHQLTQAANVSLGRRVRELRIAAGLSQRQLGRRCRVRYEFIGKMERGTGNPSLGTMAMVADAIGCKISDMFPPDTPGFVSVRVDDMRRAQEALAVLGSVLTTHQRARRGR